MTPRPGDLASWIPCSCCEEYLCTIHGVHAFECECPPLEDWPPGSDPYSSPPPEGFLEELRGSPWL